MQPTNGSAPPSTYSYRKLDVWERAQEFAVEVIQLARSLPKDPALSVITRQIVGSAASVGANIAEGHGRFSRPAYGNHLSIAKGSASEVGSWLDLLHRLGEVDETQAVRLQAEADSLIGLLTFKIRKLCESDRLAKASKSR